MKKSIFAVILAALLLFSGCAGGTIPHPDDPTQGSPSETPSEPDNPSETPSEPDNPSETPSEPDNPSETPSEPDNPSGTPSEPDNPSEPEVPTPPELNSSVTLAKSSYSVVVQDEELGSVLLGAEAFQWPKDEKEADHVRVEDAEIRYEVENPAIASVDGEGRLTALGRGRTTVTAAYEGATAAAEVLVYESATAAEIATFGEEYLNAFGRPYVKNGALHLDNVAAGVEVSFYGSDLTANVTVEDAAYCRIYVDGKEGDFLPLETQSSLVLAQGLEEGIHTVRLVKASEVDRGAIVVNSFSAERFLAMPEPKGPKIEFIGDSITAGYGNLVTGGQWSIDNSDGCSSYAYLTAKKLEADYSVVALSGICVKTYMWGGTMNMVTMHPFVSLRNREPWSYEADTDIVVLALGTNDASYISGHASYGRTFKTDYTDFLTHLRTVYPNADIVCIYGMMGTNTVVESGIKQAISSMGDEKISYLGFRKNDAGANGHPNAAAHRSYADTLTAYLSKLL